MTCCLPHRFRPVCGLFGSALRPRTPMSARRTSRPGPTARRSVSWTVNTAALRHPSPRWGLHTVYDALAAYAAATRMGLDAARCAAALADYQTTGMRQHIVEHGGVTFIEDCYNASPDSMRAALSVLKELPNSRKIALLGDMLELGTASEEGHRNTGAWVADAGGRSADRLRSLQRSHGRGRQGARCCNCALPNGSRSATIFTAIRAPR